MGTDGRQKTAKRITDLSPERREALGLLLKQQGVDASRTVGASDPVVPVPRDNVLPLSFGQQRLWFLDQLVPDEALYYILAAQRLKGALNHGALQRALNELVIRHESLRTTFREEKGTRFQVISTPEPVEMAVIDLTGFPKVEREAEARRLAVQEAHQRFDLGHGPLLRVRLLRLDERDHVLLLVMHHIVSDAWSVGVLFQELAALYEAFTKDRPSPLSEPGIQYADYAVWQRRRLTGAVLEEQLDYWKRQLADLPTLRLPTDRPRPEMPSFRAGRESLVLPRQLCEALKRLSRSEDATLYMTLLAAFMVLLHRYSGQEDIVVGSPIAGRNRPEIENVVGFFVNTLVMRTEVSGELSFRKLLSSVREVALGAYGSQDVPFEMVVDELQPERDLSRNPLFQVAFALQNAPVAPLELAGLTVSPMEVDTQRVRFDLEAWMWEGSEGLGITFVYGTDLFEATTIRRMLGHFRVLLEAIALQPDQQVSRLPLLSKAEREEVLARGKVTTAVCPVDTCLHLLFEEQVRRSPNAVAVIFEDQQLTYEQLNARANRLAHHLIQSGVGPDVLVAVLLERSLEMVVALLGILKAGGAYVPLDPLYPHQRLTLMLEDIGAPVLLTQRDLVGDLPLPANGPSLEIMCMEDVRELVANQSRLNPVNGVRAENLAYVIYTSGSTGTPKGVLVTHANVVRLFDVTRSWFGFGPDDVWTLFHSYAFDFSVWELWGALLHGGRLVVVPYGVSRSPKAFYELLVAQRVTVLNQTPSAFRELVRQDESAGIAQDLALRLIIFGGEALNLQDLKPWFDRHGDQCPRLINMYGITETTVHVTYRPLRATDLQKAPGSVIGCPLPDLQVYILDRHLAPVPVGVPGEMYIGGAGVARGYLNRPELTTERFLPDPFRDQPGARLYKSGDLARYLHDHDIEYLGRLDEQVKIRGYRIEPGEIEQVLKRHPAVRDAVATVREYAPGDRRLVAYLVPHEQSAFGVCQLLRCQRQGLLNDRLQYELPNGRMIVHLNKNETDFLYREIFEQQSYFQHGITLNEGDCIFDVGANIGLFTLFVGQMCKNAVIYAFEPIEPVFELLRINAQLHGLNVKSFQCGLSNENTTATFSYYPHVSILSGRFADAAQEREVIRSFLANEHQAGTDTTTSPSGELLDELLEDRLTSKRVTCRLTTISDVMRDNGVERIDLLKIDVEKSEQDVLLGIREEDWPKIRQVIVEVHDSDGRLGRITSSLKGHGYDTVVEQDEALKDTSLYNVFAVRRNQNGRSKAKTTSSVGEEVTSWSSPTGLIREVRSAAKRELPEYMVPSAFVLLEELPLTPNGKINRNALPDPEASRRDVEDKYVAPRSATESALRDIWARVLRMERVGVEDNFFELGGDSILSLQVVAAANEAGLGLVPRQMFQYKTIAELAAVAGTNRPTRMEQGPVSGNVPLSPIQHEFFDQDLPDPQHFNQALLLEAPESLDPTVLEKVVQRLVEHHDALRLRFTRKASGWEQFNAQPQAAALFTRIDLSRISEGAQPAAIEEAAAKLQTSLNLSEGPLLRVALFDLGPRRRTRLLLIIHHLVVDGVSWRLLLADLQTAYEQLSRGEVIALPRKSSSFKLWAQRLNDYAQTEALGKEADYWLRLSGSPAPALPVDFPGGANTVVSASAVSVSLNTEETKALLLEVPGAYQTQINDALLTALVQGFCRWTGASKLLIDLEGHGREDVLDDIDVSRTVGWFTTIFPVLLDLGDHRDAGDALKSVKEQLRRIPNRGIGYGLLRYLRTEGQAASDLRALPRADVSFNYLGQFDQVVTGSSLFSRAQESSGLSRSPRGDRRHILEIDGSVHDGRLQVTWTYSRNLHRYSTIEGLAHGFVESLRALILHCQSSGAGGYTPSDFPEAQLSQEELDRFMARFSPASRKGSG